MVPLETELVNTANGNLHFMLPLLSRPGRNGLGVNLGLAYNSKIWEREGSQMVMYDRQSWVGAGWSLVIGRLNQGTDRYYLAFADGSVHERVADGSNLWKSMDSTYLRLDTSNPAQPVATVKGGTRFFFSPIHATTKAALRPGHRTAAGQPGAPCPVVRPGVARTAEHRQALPTMPWDGCCRLPWDRAIPRREASPTTRWDDCARKSTRKAEPRRTIMTMPETSPARPMPAG